MASTARIAIRPNGNGKMAILDLEFEHLVRALVKALCKAQEQSTSREQLLELYRILQSLYLQYRLVSRRYGATYKPSTLRTVRNASSKTRKLVKGHKEPSDVLSLIRDELAQIDRTSAFIASDRRHHRKRNILRAS